MTESRIPLIGFSAFSGTGKTTLLKQIIPLLKQQGLRIAVIKHAHHHFDLDQPGKDSFELRKAGSDKTIICTTTRMAIITEFPTPEDEPTLQEIIDTIDTDSFDLILVEGYKHLPFPKIELHRKSVGKPYLYHEDSDIIAIACDDELPHPTDISVLDINDIEGIAELVVKQTEKLK
ncbi:MAG: molybdopterin-guanine dinucleotide biosynthesis protein B [Gammaproteobacteria bacterium]|nr:molybdopterin-guanine dinucleotide biosynthesis protein B [Gammaproteobacteria bacterium]